jgi:hypothetical protein
MVRGGALNIKVDLGIFNIQFRMTNGKWLVVCAAETGIFN